MLRFVNRRVVEPASTDGLWPLLGGRSASERAQLLALLRLFEPAFVDEG